MSNSNYGFGYSGYDLGKYGNSPIENLPLGYYTRLLTSQYQQSPNLLAWLTGVLQFLDTAGQSLTEFTTAFDLDFAVSDHLDILGGIIGTSRIMNFQPSHGVSPVLDDATYRLLLKAKVAQNQWDGTIDGLQSTWQSLFPGGHIIIQDAQNMSATILMSGAFSSILVDLISNGYIVPRPEGVLYNFSFATLPVFGFDRNDAYVAGFDAGHWS